MKLIDKSAIVDEIKSRIKESEKLADVAADNNLHNTLEANELLIRQYTSLLSFLDSLEVKEVKEEPVSEELEEAARDTLDTYKPVFSSSTSEGEPIEYYSPGQMRTMFMKGSHWQKEHYPKELTNSDLETAADKYAIKIYNMFIKDETILNNKEGDEILSDAFKAGAEWMAKQGETLYDTINVDGKNQRWLGENLLQGDYDAGQAVIVQIRKL